MNIALREWNFNSRLPQLTLDRCEHIVGGGNSLTHALDKETRLKTE